LNFFDRFSKNTETSNLIKNRRVRAKLFHADRQMDMMQLIAAFHNFANTPKKDEKLKKCSFCKIIGTRQNTDIG